MLPTDVLGTCDRQAVRNGSRLVKCRKRLFYVSESGHEFAHPMSSRLPDELRNLGSFGLMTCDQSH